MFNYWHINSLVPNRELQSLSVIYGEKLELNREIRPEFSHEV